LALGERPPEVTLPPMARRALVLEDLTDVDNVGALMRIGAAFAIDSVLLSPGCADPYYRKALRTAVGCTFDLPITRATVWPDDLRRLRDQTGCRLIAAVVSKDAVPLLSYIPREPFALCVGSEGPGLSPAVQALCDDAVSIPMAKGADSLNVAVAAAIILHQLTTAISKGI
jgi:tRNA G18 (ribose-2'-O)-methylase SpoU